MSVMPIINISLFFLLGAKAVNKVLGGEGIWSIHIMDKTAVPHATYSLSSRKTTIVTIERADKALPWSV